MAKEANPTGVYSPWNFRARRLIRQLRAATHRTVQNAIIQELIHELEKGSRRARKQAALWRGQAKKYGGRAGSVLRKRAADVAHRLRYGPQLHCAGCDKQFRNKLQFAAHARAHQRQGRQPALSRAARAPKRRGVPVVTARDRGYIPGAKPAQAGDRLPGRAAGRLHAPGTPMGDPRAGEHARDVISAAGKPGRAAQAAAQQAKTAGRPLTAKDLKEMAKGTRATMPQSRTARAHASGRAMDPAVLKAARATPQTPASRAKSREQAILRRSLRSRDGAAARAASRTTPRVAPALKLAPAAPARAPRAPRSAPVRPGRTT
jgi:hypothetical protein